MTIQSVEVYDDKGLLQTGAVSSINTTAPIANTGTAQNPVIALTGTVPLAQGGTNADLSATGPGFLKQSTSGATVSVALVAAGDLTTALASPPDIGTTTPAKGYFSDLREKIGGFFAIFTHANTADRTYTLPDATTTLVGTDTTQTLTNKSIAASEINSGQLALTRGGTAVDLSATGGAHSFIAQDGSHVVSARTIADADLPTALAGHTITGGSLDNTPIGATTANSAIVSSFAELIGGFKAIFTHANSADRTYTFPNFSATLATLAGTETLSNKTLNTPNINGASITTSAVDSTPIGGTTASTGIFTAITELIGGFKAIFTHANSADRTYTLPDATTTLVGTDTTQTLTNKSIAASEINSGTLALVRGGTNVDLSASGGAHSFIAQDASHVISARTIASGDLPTIGVAQGGTGQTGAGADDTWLRSNSNVGALTEWALTAQAFSGRLSLSSTLSISGDIAASTDLYWLPYLGNKARIPSVNGLDSYLTLGDSGVHLTNSGLLPCYCYDVFGFNNSGSPSAEFLAWNAPTNAAITAISNASPPVVSTGTTPTADQIVVITGAAGAGAANINNIQFRVGTVSAGVSFQLLNLDGTNPSAPGVITGSTGTWFRYDAAQTRATALSFANGINYKNGATSRIYLGTVKMDEAGKFNDTSAKRRLLFNYFNRIERNVLAQDSTASWNYATATWRASRNTLANRIEFIAGVQEEIFKSRVHQSQQSSSSGGAVSIGSMTITANSAQTTNEASATALNGISSNLSGAVSLGYQWLQSIEYVRTGTVTYYGGTGTFADNQYGLLAEVKM